MASSLLPDSKAKQATYATFSEAATSPPRLELPEISAVPWLSRFTYTHARPLLDAGSIRRLELDDLWALEPRHHASTFYAAFQRARTAGSPPSSVQHALLHCVGPKLLLCGLGTGVRAACALFAPVVLRRVIDAFSAAPDVDMDSILSWVGAFFASRLLNAFLEAHVNFAMEMTLMEMTVSLKAVVMEKILQRDRVVSCKETQQSIHVANVVTADIDNLMWASYSLNAAWILPLQIAGVVYLLYDVLDLAAFAGLAVVVLSMALNNVVATHMKRVFDELMQLKDGRMQIVKEVFSAIQVIKLNAWEARFLERIQSWRVQELRAVAKYLYTSALSVVLLWTTPLLVSLTSFATYALVLGNELTAAKVFTAMVLFNAIRDPLSQFPGAVQSVLQARSSVDRVATFLSTNDVDTARVARDVGKYDDDVEIVVDKATFSWSGPSGEDASKAVLRDASLKVRKGDFVVVHGAVGSGKSSLCEALLGELAVTTGDVFVRSRSIAYYSQQPWIQNMSIRDNILFGLPYDKTKYDRVIDACGLVKDIAMFPARDATEIGQKGVNLSGGQKARVSLARACYADADVYVLDSPLAAVDAVVQSEIFNKCLCGLLENKTIVLVTHLEDVIHSPVANVKVHVENGSVDVSYGERSSASRRVYATPKTDVEIAEDPEAVVDGSFVETEGRQGGLVSGHVFKDYVQALGGTQVIVVFVLVLAAWQTFQISSDFWLSHWTGTREASQPDGSSNSVAYNLTVYAVLGLGTSVFVLLRAIVVAFVGTAAARRLFDDMTKSLLHAPLRFFDTNPIGRILNRYAEDVSMIDFRLPPVFFGAFVVSATNAFQLLAAVYVIRWAGILILPLGYVYIRLGGFYFTANLEVSRLRKVTTSPVLTHISQCEDGVVTLRAFGPAYVARAMQEHFRRVDDNNQAWYAQTVISQWFALRVQLIGVGVVVIIVSSLLALHDYLSPGLIGLAFMYAMNVDQQLALGLKSWLWLEMYLVSPERVLEYIGIPPEGHASDRLIVTSGLNNTEWPQQGTITFQDVKFAYKPGGDLVLKGLSFEIRHNEKIGIVGRTGAGKSSLTMSIFRINELVSGRIMIDGVDISTVNLQTLRSRMSIIPQVPVLFKGPWRAYMDPFDEYDDAAIWLALEQVALKDMVSTLDGMLQHELSDNGENFSVGERQMLCMARALLRRSRVVVMDEATASIDVKTEQKLQRMIKREFVDATVLTIAHRLSTVLDSDRIMVLSDGRVVEFDTPRVLAQVKGGVFQGLAKESGNLAQLL